jgi:hypothetical protein
MAFCLKKIEDLVPKFFSKIPSTKMGAYPEYKYIVIKKQKKFYYNNDLILMVEVPSGGINFDKFFYIPNQNYPEYGYGGWLEKIKDWAYVHE